MTLSPETADLIAGALGFLFTVALLSYLIGDNPLYRTALHIFIGVSVGYAALVLIQQVLVPRLAEPFGSSDPQVLALAAMPLALFGFLALKFSPRMAPFGNVSTAFLLGVGTALAVTGALAGTLAPQIESTWLSILPGAPGGFLNNALIIGGTVLTLLGFQFWLLGRQPAESGEPRGVMAWLARGGRVFVVVALATVYGGMILSGLVVFQERLTAVVEWLTGLIG
ncbi:MAG TPA: hypothetical protein VKY39_02415 [Aggregatilineales bacterium]|nr:hypothetical protein [Aggregatilineales bacterium]